MNYILYAGLKYSQIRHAIYCKKCKETIESKHHMILNFVHVIR